MSIWPLLAGLVAASIWGGMYVVSKVVMEVIPPFGLLASRLILGSLALLPLVLRRGGVGFTRRQWVQVLGVGLIGFGFSIGFQFVGTHLSTAANGALVTSATPAFALIFAAWILNEPITPRRLAALLVSTLGVIAVIDPRQANLSSQLFLGNLALLLAALTWALYSVLVRRVTRNLDTLPFSLVAFLGGMFFALPMAVWEQSAVGWGTLSVGALLGVLYVGLISTALAMFLWNSAFAHLEAGVAALNFFAQPVVGAALGALFLGEKLTPIFLLGGGLIGLGFVLSISQEKAG